MKLFTVLITILLCNTVFSQLYNTVSPDKNIRITFRLDNKGTPQYSITFGKTSFLKWSDLGLNLKGSGLLNSNFKVASVSRKLIDETYPIISGKSKYGRNYCNETRISLEEKSGSPRKLDLYFRAYNDGAAFRYGLPEQQNISSFIIETEETNFNFAGDYKCWAMKKDRFRHSYEGEYLDYNISNLFSKQGDSLMNFPYITLPLTMEVNNNLFFTISEAAIVDYAGMYLIQSGDQLGLKSKLSPDTVHKDISVKGNTPLVTPWRLFIIGDSPGSLIESNLILNLNKPSKIEDVSWIKPGRSTWSWWAEDRGFDPSFGYSILATNTVKYYIDYARANSIEYVILDGGWYGWFDATKDDAVHDITKSLPELDLPYVTSYANSKGVGVILWVVWYELERQFKEALDYYEKLGVKGIKVDFMDRDDQYMTDFYKRLAIECAKRKMIVMYHGAYKPDGLSRTYPNILTYEGVLGNEYARWITGLPHPNYNVVLPFTRMIAGPMDYTPGSMTNSSEKDYIGRWKYPMTKGTRAQQMAMLVVYESGIVSICESPKIYEKLPEFNFIKQVPAAWDSTIVLDGKIGEYIVIARKKDDKWFIGGMTDWKSRNININFNFLENGEYECEIYSDAEDADINPGNVSISSLNINNNNTILPFRLAKGGGLGIVIRKKQ